MNKKLSDDEWAFLNSYCGTDCVLQDKKSPCCPGDYVRNKDKYDKMHQEQREVRKKLSEEDFELIKQ